MHTVIVTLETAVVQYPAGTTSAGISFSLNVPAGSAAIPAQVLPAGTLSAIFADVPDGVGYTASAQLLDGSNQPLGAAAISAPFDIVTPTVGIATPTTITVSVS